MGAETRFRVAFAILWLLVAGGAAASGLATRTLGCTRSIGEAASCTFERSGPLGRTVRFAPGAISAVEVAERAQGKKGSPPRFAVLLFDQRGAETEVASFDRAELSYALRAELRAFLDDRKRTSYARETAPGIGAYALFAAALAVGVGLCVHAWRRMRKDRPGDVHGAPAPFDAPTPSPLSAPASAGLWVQASGGARPWILLIAGACVLSGVGTLLLFAYADRHQGALEIRAASRCRFDGAELSPGAVMSLHLDPGHYSVDVYNPLVPGNWERQTFEVRLGQKSQVSCSPGQR